MQIHNITVAEAQAWLAAQTAILIDVREHDEYAAMHIPGAQHIPLATIAPAHLNVGNKKIIIHCRSGHRSQVACAKLLSEGVTEPLYNLDGGILAWQAAGYVVDAE